MLTAHLSWLVLVALLGAWWAKLVLIQSQHITELENRLGMGAQGADQWTHTHRMLFWESSTFLVLVLAATLFLFWLYLREERRTRAIHAFFASLTHELRTPLTSIRLQAESIADGTADPEIIRRLLEDTQRLEGQVERTLELARMEGGGPLFPQPIRVRPWIERILESWHESHTGRLDISLAVTDVSVVADSSAIQVIFRNLLENSLRHGKKDRLKVSILTEEHGPEIAIRYRDDGVGFSGDSSALGRLFEKGPQSSGAGVGLYLVRVLMERMGGRVEFAGQSGFEARLFFRHGGAENV
jgi:signal transduction histidine kinase